MTPVIKKGFKKRSRAVKTFNQDLGTVLEVEEEPESEFKRRSSPEPESPFNAGLWTEAIINDAIYENVLLMADNVVKVKAFLLMTIAKWRYLKLKKSTPIIQRSYRVYRQRKLRQN
jgi:hypothetical protein